jgi:HK97 family phage portal protein
MEQTAIFLELTGAMPWYLEGLQAKNGGPVRTITPLHPNFLTPTPDKKNKISHYVYKVNDEEMKMTPKEIVYFKHFDPSDRLGIRGLGSITPASGPAVVDRLADAFNQRFFRRGAVLSGVIETDSEDIEPATMEKYAQQFRDKHAGSDRAWDVRGLSHGLKWKPTQPTHTDMLFEKLRGMNREEMLMAQGVPPIMVTLMDGATYANAQQQEFAFWISTILPKIRKIEARMNSDLASRYGGDVVFLFDVSEIRALQPNWKDIKETIVPLLERRTLNPNEARQFLSTGRLPKLEDVEHGDDYLTNFQITPFESGVENEEDDLDTPEAPDVTDEGEEPDQVENLFARMEGLAKRMDSESRRKQHNRERQALSRAIESVFFSITVELFQKQFKAAMSWLQEQEETLVQLQLKHPEKSSRFRQVADDLGVLMDQLEQAHREKYIGIYNEGVVQSATAAAAALPFEFVYSSGTLSALTFIEAETGSLITGIHATTVSAIRATVAEGVALGETITELGVRVEGVMGSKASAARARKIAQTETNKALNFGLIDSWEQTGEVDRKMWSSSGDGDVRVTHAEADGQVVGMKEKFEVGGAALLHPGDTSSGAPPEEVINCRCAMDPILVGEELSNEQSGVSTANATLGVRDARASEGSGKNGKPGRSSVVAGRRWKVSQS